MTTELYKGHEVHPAPEQLTETGEWTVRVFIAHNKGRETVEKPFSASNTFKTQEEAVKHSLIFGKQIIDGKIPGCTVLDL